MGTTCAIVSSDEHIGVVWPLALLHGLDDWMQVDSPGAAPLWWQVLVALGFGAAAWGLTRSRPCARSLGPVR